MHRAVLALLVSLLTAWAASAEQFDLVLRGGRVVDPETGLDAVRDVGLRGDRIARISSEPLEGARVLDVRGLVVAPGFIDLHQHQQDAESYRLKALDGVTMALELESGVPDVARFLEARRGKTIIHFGATASQEAARVVAWGETLAPPTFGPDAGIDDPPAGPSTNEPASQERLERILAQLRAGIRAGGLGVGMGLEYTPGATRLEVIEMCRLAAGYRLPVFVHLRSAGRIEPGSSIESVGEMIAASAVTGVAVHIVHLNSSCLGAAPECLKMIEGARARGLDVTTEGYPYGAGMTTIASAMFDPGWREKRGIDYGDVELPESGERLTRERFEALHASPQPHNVLIHMNPDQVVDEVIRHPLVMIASDGIKQHPRSAGTYSRVLARYVRAQGSLTLMDAVRKMSLMPAQRLEAATAAARRKGRIQPGADADIVVFDPQTIEDKATYRAAGAPSVGVRYLLVAGTLVVAEGRIVEGVAPGRPLTSDAIGK
jgi:N-acyl-D-aspartate/D-glutamate deacylase